MNSENIMFLFIALGMGLVSYIIRIIRSQITYFPVENILLLIQLIYCGFYILSVTKIINTDIEKLNSNFGFIGVIVVTLTFIYLGTILVFRSNRE